MVEWHKNNELLIYKIKYQKIKSKIKKLKYA